MAEIALVTGASRGIGAEIAKTLARDGFDIWLNYRSNSQKANEVKQEIEKLGVHFWNLMLPTLKKQNKLWNQCY